MMSPAFMRAFREANGSWNTICTRRRQLSSSLPRSPNGLVPSNVTVPSSGVSSIIRVRARVDLPQPDSPTRPRVSPRPTVRLIPSRALSRVLPLALLATWNVLVRPSMARRGSGIGDLLAEVAGGGAGRPRRAAGRDVRRGVAVDLADDRPEGRPLSPADVLD